jgi:hypothetical protein
MLTETEASPEAVERHLYKQDFIEIEVYKVDGRYKVLPYVGRSSSAYSEIKVQFVLPGSFQTQRLAVEAAVQAGRKKIDIGLFTDSVEQETAPPSHGMVRTHFSVVGFHSRASRCASAIC